MAFSPDGKLLAVAGYHEVLLHQGSGELQTVTGVELIDAHRPAREDPYRLSVGLVGLEAMLRLFTEQEANPRAFRALTRFLELLDALPVPADRKARAALDPLGLSFQLKLLWLSGYLPHVESCAECGAEEGLSGYSPRVGGEVCRNCTDETTLSLGPDSLAGIEELLRRPLAEADAAGLNARAARDALAVINASHEYHGGFRLRTLSA